MLKDDYKQRMNLEYLQLRERFNKLSIMLKKYNDGTLEFEPSCPIELLESQYLTMYTYLKILEKRAKIENVNIPKKLL